MNCTIGLSEDVCFRSSVCTHARKSAVASPPAAAAMSVCGRQQEPASTCRSALVVGDSSGECLSFPRNICCNRIASCENTKHQQSVTSEQYSHAVSTRKPKTATPTHTQTFDPATVFLLHFVRVCVSVKQFVWRPNQCECHGKVRIRVSD